MPLILQFRSGMLRFGFGFDALRSRPEAWIVISAFRIWPRRADTAPRRGHAGPEPRRPCLSERRKARTLANRRQAESVGRTPSLTSSVFFGGSGCAFRLPFRVEGLSGFDHFADNAEEAVCDASEGAGVLVPAAPQRVVFCPADAVAPDGGHGPVVGGVPEPPVRGLPSLDQDGLSGPFRDGRDAEVASQGVPVGPPDAVEGFGEDDGQNAGSDAGNGSQDVDGASAFHRPDPVEDLLDLLLDVLDFGFEGFESSEESSGGVGDGLGGSRRGRDGFAAKHGQDAFGAGRSDAVFSEHGFDGRQAHAAGLLRRRRECPEIEGPCSSEVRGGLEEGGGSSAGPTSSIGELAALQPLDPKI